MILWRYQFNQSKLPWSIQLFLQSHTSHEFPKRDFGKQVVVKRSCQSAWFAKWPWLHYREDDDSVFCHTCVKAFKELKMPVRNAEDAFVTRGFHNWKLATTSFHQPMKLVLPTRRLWREFLLFLRWRRARYWWGSLNGSCSGKVMSTLEGPHLPLKRTRSHLWGPKFKNFPGGAWPPLKPHAARVLL